MSEVMTTPEINYGFIENLNLVAQHIRGADKSIFSNVNEYIELSRKWATEGFQIEPEPIKYPGMFSSFSNAQQSGIFAELSAEKADSILALTVSAESIPFGNTATAVYNPITGHMDLGIPVGDNGEKWFIVNSFPDVSLGIWGDLALNSVTSDVYEKQESESAWVLVSNIQGIQGNQGIPGMGIYPQGEATVAEINAFTIDPMSGAVWIMLDAGLVTYGSKDVSVLVGEWLGWAADGYFVNLGLIQGPAGADGSTWSSSNFDPFNAQGNPGDYHLNNSSSDYFLRGETDWALEGNLKGQIGDTGNTGATGTAGEKWFIEAYVPDPAIGVDGDLFLNSASNNYYEKVTGSWILIGTLKGQKGDTGDTGDTGATGTGIYMQGDITVSQANLLDPASLQTGFAYLMLDAGTIVIGVDPVAVNINDIIVWDETDSFMNLGAARGPKGETGDAGTDGIDGIDGVTWYTSLEDPLNVIGNDDDLWLNNSSGDYFKKIAGAWKIDGNLTGPVGPPGVNTWADIEDVPDNVEKAVNSTGDTMTGNLTIKKVGGSRVIMVQNASNDTIGFEFRNTSNENNANVKLDPTNSELIIETLADNGQVLTSLRLAVDGNMYANGQKVWTAGNDGDGSGLDADELGGTPSLDYLKRAGGNITGPLNMVAGGHASGPWNFSGNEAPTTSAEAFFDDDIVNYKTMMDLFSNVLPAAPVVYPPSYNDAVIGESKSFEITDYNASAVYEITSPYPIVVDFSGPTFDVTILYPHYIVDRMKVDINVVAVLAGSLPSYPAIISMIIDVPQETFFVYNNEDFVLNSELIIGFADEEFYNNTNFLSFMDFPNGSVGFSTQAVYTNIDFALNEELVYGFTY